MHRPFMHTCISQISRILRGRRIPSLAVTISCLPLSKLVHIFGAKKSTLVHNQVKKEAFAWLM
jgi:hypothetical protein